MKRQFLIVTALFFLSGALFAQDINHSVEFHFTKYFDTGIENSNIGAGLSYFLDSEKVNLKATFNGSNVAFDFTTYAFYFPFSIHGKSTHRFGLQGIIHLENYFEYFFETDLLANLCYKFETQTGFSILATGGLTFNNSVIHGLDQSLNQFSASISLKLMQKIFDRASIYFSVSSFDDFRYPIFVTPSYLLGFDFDVTPKIKLGIEALVRARDQFTTAPYIDYCYLTAYWRVRI